MTDVLRVVHRRQVEGKGANPVAELEPAVALLGGCVERFDSVVDTYRPTGDGSADGCFISESYDATR